MLLVQLIKDNKAQYIDGLKKRGIPNAQDLLDEVIAIDDNRKKTQAEQDQVLNESNTLSKQIGMHMKEGKKEEAEEVKAKTSQLKESGKVLSEALNALNTDLKDKLYQIPNIPHPSVKAGTSEEDNEVVFQTHSFA